MKTTTENKFFMDFIRTLRTGSSSADGSGLEEAAVDPLSYLISVDKYYLLFSQRLVFKQSKAAKVYLC